MTKKPSKLKTAFPNNLHPGVLEKDPAKNQIADQVIDLILKGAHQDDTSATLDLIQKAGDRAVANRHFITFMGCKDDGSFQITGTSIAYAQKNPEYDEHGSVLPWILPPYCEEAARLTWQYMEPKPLEDAVRELRKIGFMWDEAEQRKTDKECGVALADTIKSIYAEAPAKKAKNTYLGKRETNVKKNAAADKIIELMMNGTDTCDIDPALIKQAGKAIANRHFFTLQGGFDEGDMGFSVSGSSIAYTEKHNAYDFDTSLIEGLLPDDLGESAALTWVYNEPKSVEACVREMRDAGFMWSPELQKNEDKATGIKLADRIAKIYAAPAPAAKKHKPKN